MINSFLKYSREILIATTIMSLSSFFVLNNINKKTQELSNDISKTKNQAQSLYEHNNKIMAEFDSLFDKVSENKQEINVLLEDVNNKFASFEPFYFGTRLVDNLTRNTYNLERTVCDKSESEGVLDMIKMMNDSPLEESWYYLPQEKRWYENGFDEKVSFYESDYISSGAIQDNRNILSVADSSDVVFYHIHPSNRNIKNTSSTNVEDILDMENHIKNKFSSTYDLLKNMFTSIKTVPPSIVDLVGMTEYYLRISKKRPDLNIKFKICSEYGVSEYGLTKKGISHYKTNEIDDDMFKNVKLIKENNGCFEFISDYINITFKPHNDLKINF